MAAAEISTRSTASSHKKNRNFSAFPEFVIIQELGLYVWDPGPDSNAQLKAFSDVTADDILDRVHIREGRTLGLDEMISNITLDSPPTINYSRVRFPVLIQTLPSQNFPNRFPNNPGYLVPLYAAVRKGASFDDIDFLLGGSALEFLAHQRIESGTRYLVQRVRNIIFLVKSKSYVSNYADGGFQFERLVTGGRMEDKHSIAMHENLQLMKIGGSSVLFSAEVDAVDDQGSEKISWCGQICFMREVDLDVFGACVCY